MRALCVSLWQPWASLIGHGKLIETRSWRTDYRGPLAIHAAQKWNGRLATIILQEPFRSSLQAAGFPRGDGLPLGAIVAVCTLRDCVQIGQGDLFSSPSFLPTDPVELAFGDYRPGRYMWMLSDVMTLPEPIATVGYQRLWRVDLDVSYQPGPSRKVSYEHV